MKLCLIPILLVVYIFWVIFRYEKHPHFGMTPVELVEANGYPIETYYITTNDEYIITLHRIPCGIKNFQKKNGPVLLFPSLLASSAEWVNMGVAQSFGYLLAENGYDVWMANPRGTTYSRKHRFLNPDNRKDRKAFWNFSLDEVFEDTASSIDFILRETQEKQLHYVGYSQGATLLLALISEKPEYMQKIRLFTAFSPSVFLQNMSSVIGNLLLNHMPSIANFLEIFEIYEFLPNSKYTQMFSSTFCNEETIFQELCILLFNSICGFGSRGFNRTMIPIIGSNMPAGGSTKQLLQFYQFVQSGKFHKFDYGKEMNFRFYGAEFPPEYKLDSITLPIALYYADLDSLVTKKNIENLVNHLPNVVYKQEVKNFNHMGFVYGENLKEVLFDKVLQIMDLYN